MTEGKLRQMRPEESTMFAAWEEAERRYPWTADQFVETARPANPIRTLVLESPDGILGYAALQVFGPEAYLSNIMVDKDRRRRGIAGKILEKVMIWAASEGAKTLMLDVDVENTPAVNLYKKHGFEIAQTRKKSYPRGEDAYVMRKNL